LADLDKQIVLTGYITGEPLHQLFSHAGLSAPPSSHEGLPIALLETMSYGLPVLVSDIAANREVPLDPPRYFSTGNVEELRQKTSGLGNQGINAEEQRKYRERIAREYNWSTIAGQTIEVHAQVLKGKNAQKR